MFIYMYIHWPFALADILFNTYYTFQQVENEPTTAVNAVEYLEFFFGCCTLKSVSVSDLFTADVIAMAITWATPTLSVFDIFPFLHFII